MYASLIIGLWALVCASLLTVGAAAGQTTGGAAAHSPGDPPMKSGGST